MNTKQFFNEIFEMIKEQYEMGMPMQTIVSNVNALVEPKIGFANALVTSDVVDKFLREVRSAKSEYSMTIESWYKILGREAAKAKAAREAKGA